MKLLEINVFNYRLGGSETVMLNTSDLFRKQGHEVIHFSLKWKKNVPCEQSKYFPESKETRGGLFKYLKNILTYFYHNEARQKLDKLLANEKPDIAQIHLFWGQITPSVLPVLKKHNVPVIFTIHEYRMVCPNYTFRNGKGEVCEQCEGKKFWKCVANKCCQGSYLLSVMMAAEMYFRNTFFNPAIYIDGLVYVSEFAKKQHEKYMPALKKKKNIVLYNLSDYIYDVVNIPVVPRYYLYFGRLSYEKGIGTLVSAFVNMPDKKLKIVGTGIETENLKKLATENGCENIEFLGFKKGQELHELVRNAYFVIVPSEWYENNPMTIVESYSASTPVIGAKIGGIPEIVDEGKTGFLFASGNQQELESCLDIAHCLEHNVYIEMRRNALFFARKYFNRDNYYSQLYSFFRGYI